MSGISSTIMWGLISLILIMLIHHIFYYLRNTLTTPKIRDLIDEPHNTYLEIQETINKSSNEDKHMKNELTDFLSELSKKKEIQPTSQSAEQYASY
jgi:DNA-binding transcriptional regulator GbsR (MarR family)